MIEISYYYDVSMEFKANVFETEEESKQWIIREVIDKNYINNWCDEDVVYDTPGEIENCLQTISLNDIIDSFKNKGIEIQLFYK